jgi:hypothetical protein
MHDLVVSPDGNPIVTAHNPNLDDYAGAPSWIAIYAR